MSLRQVEGQPRAIAALRRALAGRRLHHAYLFAGPDGVGKGLAAQGLAETLLCESPRDDADACGVCSACQRAASRQHPDLHVVERLTRPDGKIEASIKISQVRALQQALSFKAFEGRRRVVLLFDAHRMTPSTANALLKTLEEPGPDTHFVVVTASPHLLLPTILSRCQRIRFQPLPRKLVARHLIDGADVDDDTAVLLAGLAEGSIGKGLELARSPLLEQRAELIAQVDDPDGLRRVRELLDLAERLGRSAPELPMFFRLLRAWYRDVLLVAEGAGDEVLVHRDLIARVHARAGELAAGEVLARLDLLNETERAITRRSANARLSLETLLLGLAAPGGGRPGGPVTYSAA